MPDASQRAALAATYDLGDSDQDWEQDAYWVDTDKACGVMLELMSPQRPISGGVKESPRE